MHRPFHLSSRSILTAVVCAAVCLLPHIGSAQFQPDTPQVDLPVVVLGGTVNGNKTTKEHIILRELTVREGDTLGVKALYRELDRSRQNLQNLGLFNTVQVLPLWVSPTEAIIEVTVNERWYLWPNPIFELADPNFNTWWRTRDPSRLNYGIFLTKYNFRGRNETVFLQLQFGYAQQFGLRYRVPWIDRKQHWGMSVGGGWFQQKEITIGTVDNVRVFHSPTKGNAREETHADVEVTYRRQHDVRHSLRLGFTQADVVDSVALRAPDYFNDTATHTRFLSLGYTVSWDRRDVRVFPRRGHFADLRVLRNGLGLLDEQAPNTTTVFASVNKWLPVRERYTFNASVRGKATFGGPVPYFTQEGLGYSSNAVRGFEYYVIDGQHWLLGRANIVYTLVKPLVRRAEFMPLEEFRTFNLALYLHAFVDAGHVWDARYAERNFLDNEWQSGSGLGLDLVTSYDQIIRLEYSFNSIGEQGIYLHFTQPF
ncbi:MAG: BamA/TamA family outer membrane protein [Flavobacteriales bacterium]|nr:MAG: BamA/TamA family outer membrane protein [Flavobacteriales bacterium]